MERRALPGYIFLFFWAWILQPPNIDWGAFSRLVSHASPATAGWTVAAGMATWAFAWSRSARQVVFAPALGWLWRSPSPPWHWAPWLVRELQWMVVPVALFSLLWTGPHPIAQAFVWAGVLAPMQLAAAGTGPRALAWFAGLVALAAGVVSLGRAAPQWLPALAVAQTAGGVALLTAVYHDLMYRYTGAPPTLPGRPRTPLAAMLRWDATCLGRREPRVYGVAVVAALVLAASLYTFRVNGGLTGATLGDAALIHLAGASPVASLALYRLLELQRGNLNPPSLPVRPGTRVVALWGVTAACLLPVTGALAGVAGPIAGARLAAYAAWIAAIGVALAAGRRVGEGHQLPFGVHLILVGLAAPLVISWEAGGIAVAAAGTVAALALARWRLARVQGAQ